MAHTHETRAEAGRKGSLRSAQVTRAARLDGLAFAKAWKAPGGGRERAEALWHDYVAQHYRLRSEGRA